MSMPHSGTCRCADCQDIDSHPFDVLNTHGAVVSRERDIGGAIREAVKAAAPARIETKCAQPSEHHESCDCAGTVDCSSCEERGRACDGGDHCDNCGVRMDGDLAATADVCHDCWRSVKPRTEEQEFSEAYEADVQRQLAELDQIIPSVIRENARTEAEQAVLDAMESENPDQLRWCVNNLVNLHGLREACRAEIARRGLK